MKITKILNNNVAVACGQQGQEIIVMGRGLSFGAKPGDTVDDARVEKVFTMESDMARRMQQVMADIPLAHLLLADRAITYAKTELGKKLHDCIYVTLPDHISSAISRYQEGIVLKNPLLWDVKRFYRDEYTIGLKVNSIVKEETGIEFLEDEAAFIAMHFVNAQLGDQTNAVYDVTYIMQEICQIVKDEYRISFDEESLDYYRFITHVKFLAQRLRANQHYEGDNEELLSVIQYKYKRAFACAQKVSDFLNERHHYDIGAEELLYMTIHIARVTRKKE